jgi:hypothetical protein
MYGEIVNVISPFLEQMETCISKQIQILQQQLALVEIIHQRLEKERKRSSSPLPVSRIQNSSFWSEEGTSPKKWKRKPFGHRANPSTDLPAPEHPPGEGYTTQETVTTNKYCMHGLPRD